MKLKMANNDKKRTWVRRIIAAVLVIMLVVAFAGTLIFYLVAA